MKIGTSELDNRFFLELEAETSEDAALLVRMGLNSTKEISVSAYAPQGGPISAQISIGKNRLTSGEIGRK